MSSESVATIVLVSSSGIDQESTAYARCWEIPAGHAEVFARLMTDRFGQPINEGVASLGNLGVATERAAESGVIITGRSG